MVKCLKQYLAPSGFKREALNVFDALPKPVLPHWQCRNRSLLTGRIHMYSVILFDEIEKAHTDVFNVLLQILDDGRLTDGHGRTVDFKNTVVIMTSNVGSHLILAYRGGDDPESFQQMKNDVLEALRQQFRSEFLNRVDEIVVFHSLSREHLKEIVEIQLQRLRARLAERHITLELSDRAREHLAAVGYDPSYGARPLKRVIQRELETPLGRSLLRGEVKDGQTVLVDYDRARNELTFSAQPLTGAGAPNGDARAGAPAA